jgi:hypothetical protein
MAVLPWRRWRLFAVDIADGLPGLAERFNDQPEQFLLRGSARRAARFYEEMLPVHFYVLPVGRAGRPMEDDD